MKKLLIPFLVLLVVFGLYGYTQFVKKSFVSAVLMHRIDLSNPPEAIFAITTNDQNLSDGKMLPKGTKFIGKVNTESDGYVIHFNSVQTSDGQTMQLLAKSNLNIKQVKQESGVSAKLGTTLHQQTKTNVLGAIFNNPQINQNENGSILQRGSYLKIEID